MRPSTRGMSLIEVVVAGAIMVVVLLAIGVMLSTAARNTREAGPRLLAQDAATRVAERLRSLPYANGFDAFWTVAPIQTISGTAWACPDITNAATYTNTPWQDCITPLITAMSGTKRKMIPPGDAPTRPLRVRFCTESEYQSLWGVTAAVADLDFNGTVETTGNNRVDYGVRPVLIQVRWREQGTGSTGMQDESY